MEVESLLKRGSIHNTYCEDNIFYSKVSDEWMIGAVMDGCSSAKESFFASALLSKLIGKACKTLPYLSKIQPELSLYELSPKNLGELVLNQIFDNTKKVYEQLLLDEIEILSTLTIAVVNIKTNAAWINISGDGFIEIDNELIEINQNNVPDYLGYHLRLPFNVWLKKHTKSFEINKFERLTISTDGISKFMNKSGSFPENTIPREILLSINTNTTLSLHESFHLLEEKHKLTPYDDIGIIRFC